MISSGLKRFFICLLLIVVGCSRNSNNDLQKWMEPNGRVKVLSTISMIDDLVKRIGGDRVDTLVLVQGELDPHSYQLVKGDDEKLAFSDVIFFNGLGLEHGPSLQKYLQEDRKAVALGNKIFEETPGIILQYDGQADPHIWMDISLWERALPHIVKALSYHDPAHSDLFKKNAQALSQEMLAAHESTRARLQQIPDAKRYLVTSHDAFNYFTRAYLASDKERQNGGWQARFAAPEGLAPDSQLSPSHIQQILDHVAKYQVHVIFPESNVSKDSLRKILQSGKEKGLDLVMANVALYGDAMGAPGSDGDTYLKMISHNAATIADLLNRNFATQGPNRP